MTFPYKDLSETGLVDLATEATHEFLNNGVPLSDAVTKIAKREDLTPHEVHRVVEEANKAAYLAVRPKMALEGHPVFEFKLADRDEVLAGLGKTSEDKYLAWQATDVEDNEEKTAADRVIHSLRNYPEWHGTPKQILERGISDLELERIKISEEIFDCETKALSARKSFVRTSKDLVRQDGWEIEKLAELLLDARPEAGYILADVLGEVRSRCGILPHTKEAGPYYGRFNKTPTISGEPVQVINGSHKLLMDLDTLVEQTNDIEGKQQGLYRVDDTISYLRKNLQNLTSKESSKPPHVFRRVDREPDTGKAEGHYGY